MLPCNPYLPQAPALYIYYALASLIVVVLAISLIWLPFAHLIAEFNTLIVKVLMYANKELLNNSIDGFLGHLEDFFCSQITLLVLTLTGLIYILYLASGDFLIFAGCFVCNMPDGPIMTKIKKSASDIIDYLLKFTKKRRYLTFEEDKGFKNIRATNRTENQGGSKN